MFHRRDEDSTLHNRTIRRRRATLASAFDTRIAGLLSAVGRRESGASDSLSRGVRGDEGAGGITRDIT